MTKAAHTAGPWKIQVYTTAILVLSEREGCICEMLPDRGTKPKYRIANARYNRRCA
jgi:hypothetical protein